MRDLLFPFEYTQIYPKIGEKDLMRDQESAMKYNHVNVDLLTQYLQISLYLLVLYLKQPNAGGQYYNLTPKQLSPDLKKH